MKFFLISDNLDSCTGFRLAGIEGVVVDNKQALMEYVNKCLSDPEIGIILITEKLANLEHEKIYNLKLQNSKPLIVEVPSAGEPFQLLNSITKYIRDAIGVKI